MTINYNCYNLNWQQYNCQLASMISIEQGQQLLTQTLRIENEKKWRQTYQNVKKGLTGSDQQKDAVLRKRILKFFQDYKLESDLYFIKRNEVDVGQLNPSQICDHVLFIHGIDFLPEERIRLYFQPYQVDIQIYDQSHCIIVFDNMERAFQAFFTKLVQKRSSFMSFQQSCLKDRRNMVQWQEIQGYIEMMFERKLWARFASKHDISTRNTDFSRTIIDTFEAAKHRFLQSVTQKSRMSKYKSHHENRKYFTWKNQKQNETRSECCFQCTKKLQQYMRNNPCKHLSSSFGAKKEEQTEDHFCKNKYLQKSKSRKPSYKSKPLPTIGESHHILSQKKSAKKDKIEESFQEQAEDKLSKPSDILYHSMVQEFEKYKISDNISEISQRSLGSSRQGISFFEVDQNN